MEHETDPSINQIKPDLKSSLELNLAMLIEKYGIEASSIEEDRPDPLAPVEEQIAFSNRAAALSGSLRALRELEERSKSK